MGQLNNTVKCKTCEENHAKSSKDPNNPFFDDDADFSITLEWLNKTEAIKRIEETKCPKCNSGDWYFTDTANN